MPEWRYVHIGFEGDAKRIGGLPVWQESWRPIEAEPLELPHPAYPGQTHLYDIYEMGDSRRPVRFAAGELSNGVWGFYVPADTPPRPGPTARRSAAAANRAGAPDRDDNWFVYTRTAGRITAMPANRRGWAAFLAAVAANILVAYALMAATVGLHPLLRLGLLIPAIGLGVWLIAKLALAKGRPAG